MSFLCGRAHPLYVKPARGDDPLTVHLDEEVDGVGNELERAPSDSRTTIEPTEFAE